MVPKSRLYVCLLCALVDPTSVLYTELGSHVFLQRLKLHPLVRSLSGPLLGSLSALAKVSEALGGGEGVRLQGEEVLLGKQEAGTLRRDGGLVQLQL